MEVEGELFEGQKKGKLMEKRAMERNRTNTDGFLSYLESIFKYMHVRLVMERKVGIVAVGKARVGNRVNMRKL